MDTRNKLKSLIIKSTADVIYTYSSHWHIVCRLKKILTYIKVAQIILTALSTGGFFLLLATQALWPGWMAGVASAVALALNLYLLNFNIPDNIEKHRNAANDLWNIKEAYKSLLVDFDFLTVQSVCDKRDHLSELVSLVNKKYPETDAEGFRDACNDIEKYIYADGEAEKLISINLKDK